jgi:DNA-binding transcriptional MerR regulator
LHCELAPLTLGVVSRQEPIDAQVLQDAAAARGTRVTARQLELWRYRGLLPRPVRQSGGRGRWVYPARTIEQLHRLLYWRERAGTLDLIRIGLWIDGFPIALEGVRRALASFVDEWASMLVRERPSEKDDPTATIDAFARRLAGMRGRALVPRVVRMTVDERTRAYAYMLAVMFDLQGEVERRSGDAWLVERMLGLRSGRGGGLAAAIALESVSERLARLPQPDEVSGVIADVTDDEFEFVRRLVQVMTVWTPLLLPLLLDDVGAKAEPFATLARSFFADTPPGFYPFIVVTLLVMLRAKGRDHADLRTHVLALTPGAVDVEMLRTLPVGARRGAFEQLPKQTKAVVLTELQRASEKPASTGTQNRLSGHDRR